MKVAIVRGKYLNQFEMQSYEPLAARHELIGFASLTPLHERFAFPVVKSPSPMDLPNFPFKMPVLNRLMIDAQYLWGLEEKLRGFDIAHSAETYFHFTQQCLNAKSKGYVKKVVVTVWENIPFNNEGIWGRKNFKQRAIKEADHFFAVTNKAKEALVKEGCPPEKITVIPMGVDLKKFKVQSSKFKIKDNKLNILFVGRLEEEKGVFELLEAFKQLVKIYPRLKLTMVGDGSWKKAFVHQAIQLIKVPYEQMPEQYQKADILCLPSKPTKYWQEQFGMALVEAMASGLPIVSTTSGVIPEVVGKAGILVKPGETKPLYQALKSLIENESLRKNLGKLARVRAEQVFDANKVATKIENLYEKTLHCYS